MTQVASTSGREQGITAPIAANETESQKRAHQIAEIDRLCVAPVRQARAAWFKDTEGFREAIRARDKTRNFVAEKFVAEVSEERRQSQREYWQASLAKIMPRRDAEAVVRTMQAAWNGRPSRNRSGVIIARMIDSFPNARPHSPATYRENLVHLCHVDGYSAAVVALACDRIMRDPAHEFLPAPAAFIAACKQEFDDLQSTHRHAYMTLEGRNCLETALAQLDGAEAGTAPVLPMPVGDDLKPPPAPVRSAFV